MRGEIIYKVLDFLENRVMDQIDFFRAFLEVGYGSSLGKLEYGLEKKKRGRNTDNIRRDKIRNFQKYFYKLKKDGLISVNPPEKIVLSNKGKKKLISLRKKSLNWKNTYKKEVGEKVIIISYDIPVAFNNERNILRDMLRILGFNIIHKSVWVGKVKLPKSFLEDLNRLEILDFIEILEVTKTGSLKLYN